MKEVTEQRDLLTPSIKRDYAGFVNKNGKINSTRTIKELKERYIEICNEYFENIAGHKRELLSHEELEESRKRALQFIMTI